MTSGRSPLVRGMKNAVMYGIIVGTQTALCSAISSNLISRNTKVVQPLFGDFFTGAVLHRLLDVVAGTVGEESVYPYAYLILVLYP